MKEVLSGGPAIVNVPGNSPNTGVQLVTIQLGDDDQFDALLMGHDTVSQPYRTQFDVAIDGSEYIIAAGKGIGEYEFSILDGPFTCADFKDRSSILTKLQGFNNSVTNRTILMTLNNAGAAAGGSSHLFSGVVSKVTTTLRVMDDGTKAVISTVTAEGSWL